jgi:hypothetical protein
MKNGRDQWEKEEFKGLSLSLSTQKQQLQVIGKLDIDETDADLSMKKETRFRLQL